MKYGERDRKRERWREKRGNEREIKKESGEMGEREREK